MINCETKYIISDDMYMKCKKFAEESVTSSADKYARRQQFDIEKIKKDIFNGKIGEQGTWNCLSEFYPKLSQPDFEIYSKYQKSWDADLKDPSGIKIAVKSQNIDSALAFGESWVFQIGDGKKDCDQEVFKNVKDQDYVVFNSLNVPKRFGKIMAIVKIKWLHEKNLFKPMQLKQLQSNKLAVYLDDLLSFNDELFQL